MNYTHITREERYQIYALKKAGHKQYEIAEVLKRSESTISRELSRNCGRRGYDGLVDIGFDKHFRVNHSTNEFAKGEYHINGIESFWSYANRRLRSST